MQGPLADGRKSGNPLYRTVGGPALTKSPAPPRAINARCIAPFEPRPLAAVTFPSAASPRAWFALSPTEGFASPLAA